MRLRFENHWRMWVTTLSKDIEGGVQLKTPVLLLTALVLCGLGVRLYVSFAPLEKLLAVCLSDDSFYYYSIARNIIAGNGVTFDGVISTNGFHPLYLLLLLPLTLLAQGDPELPVRLSLVLLSLAGAATAIPIYAIVCRTGSRIAGLLAALFWLFNPWSIFIGLTGVEIALAVLFLILAFHQYLRILDASDPGSGAYVLLGALVGLALLSRTDLVIPLGVLGAALATRTMFSGKPAAASVKNLSLCLASAFALVLPWVCWNLIKFGSVSQISGRTLFFRSHSQVSIFKGEGAGVVLEHAWSQLAGTAGRWGLNLMGFSDPRTSVLFFLLILIALFAVKMIGGQGMPKNFSVKGLPEIGFGLLLHWLFYAAIFWQAKSWYFLPAVLGLSVLVGLAVSVIDHLMVSRSGGKRGALVIVLLAVFFTGGHVQKGLELWRAEMQPWQRHYLSIGKDLAADHIVKEDQPGLIGSFNAGIIGYFSGRRVVNLDGVVNDRILPAMRAGRFDVYLQEENVRYLIDHLDLILEYSAWSAADYQGNLEAVRKLAPSQFGGDIVLMKFGSGRENVGKKMPDDVSTDTSLQGVQ